MIKYIHTYFGEAACFIQIGTIIMYNDDKPVIIRINLQCVVVVVVVVVVCAWWQLVWRNS